MAGGPAATVLFHEKHLSPRDLYWEHDAHFFNENGNVAVGRYPCGLVCLALPGKPLQALNSTVFFSVLRGCHLLATVPGDPDCFSCSLLRRNPKSCTIVVAAATISKLATNPGMRFSIT
jgi:hypothetical protein